MNGLQHRWKAWKSNLLYHLLPRINRIFFFFFATNVSGSFSWNRTVCLLFNLLPPLGSIVIQIFLNSTQIQSQCAYIPLNGNTHKSHLWMTDIRLRTRREKNHNGTTHVIDRTIWVCSFFLGVRGIMCVSEWVNSAPGGGNRMAIFYLVMIFVSFS